MAVYHIRMEVVYSLQGSIKTISQIPGILRLYHLQSGLFCFFGKRPLTKTDQAEIIITSQLLS